MLPTTLILMNIEHSIGKNNIIIVIYIIIFPLDPKYPTTSCLDSTFICLITLHLVLPLLPFDVCFHYLSISWHHPFNNTTTPHTTWIYSPCFHLIRIGMAIYCWHGLDLGTWTLLCFVRLCYAGRYIIYYILYIILRLGNNWIALRVLELNWISCMCMWG